MKNNIIMNACIVPKYGTEEDIIIREILKPIPREKELLIKVHYAPVTPTDLTSKKGDSFIFRLFSSLIRPKFGVYGEMYVGEVTEVGELVKDFNIGDLVYGTNGMKLGTYAEYVRVKDTTVIRKVPKGVEPINTLALLDGGITALPFLRDKGLIQKGQKVLIIGASGSVGSMGVQLAKNYGAIVTGVSGTSNQELLKDIGCDYVIDYTKTKYTESNYRYDIIFDAVGKSSFIECQNILTEKGSYLITVPDLPAMLKALFKVKQKNKKSLFAATGLRKPNLKNIDLDYLEGLLINKKITPVIEKIFDIKDMTKAQQHVRTGHKKGNIIVDLRKI
ncbi:Zinc-type alcohol dehydrogenase-like protein [Candidatus Izimaplasma bacterium HR1]|jgi:NADPH:quinone reductase-like Zn-dependent oxidoreductase|uniref:NAD(P)-dependent alcohol dehydrogenase n=1 Tax=Candidatus Izimoplasma sp. HR1 TaxID=1541959 RepID=UPI0004F8ED27|nr:Zinc-type alcohol dehydrogenase-like protein [Candidatus Izimaplasma bacterium HR1]